MVNEDAAAQEKGGQEPKLAMLKRQFENYASTKSKEIEEWRESHRYYAGKHYTGEQLRVLAQRKQPAIAFNRISRKIDGVVGTIRRLRNDPKSFPRHAGQDDAAELATQVVRYVCDASQFESIEADALHNAAVIGYGVLELSMSGDASDPDIEMMSVDARTFFYDPRSTKADFSDARYMGTYKWVSKDEIDEILPGAGDRVQGESAGDFSTQAEMDRDDKWVDDKERVKLVDHWYIQGGRWMWCLHVGSTTLMSGESPFYDDKGRSICKYRAFSAFVDDEGDRYGLVRNLKGPQDAMNQHRSKSVWIMNARQIVARQGEAADVEKWRSEAMRPDGVILYQGDPANFRFEQPAQEFLQQSQYYEDAKNEIENFGPNPALIGTGVQAKSGRAFAMLQQAAMAELGPFLANYRQWKLDVYRAVWSACKRYWKGERWLRITGDTDVAQFVKINEMQIDPYGMPIVVNQLGMIDVDIIMDEGPDTENLMGDVFDSLQAISQNGAPVPPQVLIEMSALPSSVKKKLIEMMQPPPQVEAAQEQSIALQMEQERAKTQKTQAETYKITTDGLINEQMLGMAPGMDTQAPMAQGDLQQAPQPAPQQSEPPAEPAAPLVAPVSITLDTNHAMAGIADEVHGMVAQNSEFMTQAAASLAQSAQMMAEAVQVMGQTAQVSAQASSVIADAATRMAAPKRIMRDPATGRAIGVETALN